MPIANYVKPQSFVQQYLQVLNDAIAANINAFVYGPQYRLSRYTDPDEKSETPSTAIVASATFDASIDASDPFIFADELFDSNYFKVYAENAEADLGQIGGNDSLFYILSLAEPEKIVYKGPVSITPATTSVPTVEGRKLAVGDVIDVTDATANVFRREITAIEETDDVDRSVLVLNGPAVTTYLSAGWTSANLTDGTGDLTASLVVKFNGPLNSVDTIYNASTGEITVQDGVSAGTLPTIEVPGTNSGGELVSKALKTGVGSYHLHYRALVKPSVNAPIRKIKTYDDINTYFGVIDPDNTLAYGASRALSGAGGKQIFAASVADTSLEAYNDVLKAASQNRDLYAHCPLTFDLGIQQAVAQHCEAMSSWDVKRWRRAYVATDLSDGDSVVTDDGAGGDYSGSIDSDTKLFTIEESTDLDFAEAGVGADDILRINYAGNDTSSSDYETYTVSKVLGPKSILLKTAPVGDVLAQNFQIWRGDTALAQVQYAANRSEQLGTRRAINVWCDSGTIIDSNGDTVVVDNIFLAAEIAGLRSAALPHQGLTRTEITSVSEAPLMYTKYTDDELNIAAAAGVFIVTQDLEDGDVYIRHQLTTQVGKGSLYYEDSVGVNLDEISFGVADIVEGYIGKYNATPSTVTTIRNRIQEFLHNKSRADRTVVIGPQIINFLNEDLDVEIDETLRDRINVKADLTLPLPLNVIVVELFGGVTFNN